MKISIIIPAYNAESTLNECLRAVFNSNYHSYEVIVVDDNSTDSTAEIVKRFKCKLVKLKKRRGAAIARNFGAKLATGKILCFIDADVLIRKDALKLIAERFKKTKIDSLTGRYSKKTKFKNFTSVYKNLFNRYFFTYRRSHSNIFFTPLAAIKGSVFKKLGGFQKYGRMEDIDFGFRLIKSGYKMTMDKNLEVKHLKHFSFFELLRIKIDIYKEISHYFLTRGVCKKAITQDILFFINLILPFIIIFFLLMEIFYWNGLFISLFLLSFIILNLDFFVFLKESEGIIFLLKSLPTFFLDMLMMGVGCIMGGLNFLWFKLKTL